MRQTLGLILPVPFYIYTGIETPVEDSKEWIHCTMEAKWYQVLVTSGILHPQLILQPLFNPHPFQWESYVHTKHSPVEINRKCLTLAVSYLLILCLKIIVGRVVISPFPCWFIARKLVNHWHTGSLLFGSAVLWPSAYLRMHTKQMDPTKAVKYNEKVQPCKNA